MKEYFIMFGILILGVLIGFLTHVIFFDYNKKQDYDGRITLENVDKEQDGMFMELYISYDQLLEKKELLFHVENNLSQK